MLFAESAISTQFRAIKVARYSCALSLYKRSTPSEIRFELTRFLRLEQKEQLSKSPNFSNFKLLYYLRNLWIVPIKLPMHVPLRVIDDPILRSSEWIVVVGDLHGDAQSLSLRVG